MKKGLLFKFGILAVVLVLSFSSINAQTSGTTGTTASGQRYLVTPNPSASFAMVIALGEGNNISRVAIFNGLGQLVRDNNYSDNNTRVAMMDVSTLSAGIYTISISGSLVTETQVIGVSFPICPPYCP